MKGPTTAPRPRLLFNDRDCVVTILGIEPEDLPGGYSYRQCGPQDTKYGHFVYTWKVSAKAREFFALSEELDRSGHRDHKCHFWHRPGREAAA